jgi:hypothetical protein
MNSGHRVLYGHCIETILYVSNCHSRGEREMHAEFWRGNLMRKNYLEDQGVGGRIILK